MNNDRLYELISRKLAGQATPEELNELREYFRKNPHDQYFDELITSYWNSQHPQEQDEADSDEHFNHILQMADELPQASDPDTEDVLFQPGDRTPRKKVRRLITGLGLAASLVTLILLSGLFRSNNSDISVTLPVQQSEIVAHKGTRSRIVLPDSSVVYLNAGTRLNYPRPFSQQKREVYLDGEAFFDVKKDPAKPFIVHTSGIQVRVLGTTFNVKAYSTGGSIETSLITGSIEVTVNNRPNEKITLAPNAKLIIRNHDQQSVSPENKNQDLNPDFAINALKHDPVNNTIAETQWVENKLVFRDETFDEVARMMERWYNVTIEIDNEELKKNLLSGTFENETIEEALDALKYTKNFRYSTTREKITIYK